MLKGRIHSIESFGTVDGPGIRFVAFMQGCPMRCEFCHNPDTWDPRAKVQYELTPEELLERVKRYRKFIRNGGVTLSGGEPLMQAEFVSEFFRICREAGFHTALDTSGAIFGEAARGALDAADLVLLDVKTADDSLHKSYTGQSRDNNKACLEYLQSIGKPVWIRHVVVPGRTDSEESVKLLENYLKPYSVVEKVELLPYHTMGVFKYRQMGIPYPLEGVPALSGERIRELQAMFD